MKTLLPCPFCGSTKISIEGEQIQSDLLDDPEMKHLPIISVCCEDCGASAALGQTAEKAANVWNTRAPIDTYTTGGGSSHIELEAM